MDVEPDLRSFIEENICNSWALELLLLLSGDAARRWRPEQLVAELRSNRGLVDDNLRLFERNGLATCAEDGWRFCPANTKLAELTGTLARVFRERPAATLRLIADPIQSLSNAFKVKRGD